MDKSLEKLYSAAGQSNQGQANGEANFRAD
jgi:hypothetical protein